MKGDDNMERGAHCKPVSVSLFIVTEKDNDMERGAHCKPISAKCPCNGDG
jgi:hypothetical protein